VKDCGHIAPLYSREGAQQAPTKEMAASGKGRTAKYGFDKKNETASLVRVQTLQKYFKLIQIDTASLTRETM
jgi:hypothetical protein